MTIERTTHMAFGIDLFEHMDDKTLAECFKRGTAEEIRQYLADLRKRGFEYVPCACGNYDANGACNGGISKTKK